MKNKALENGWQGGRKKDGKGRKNRTEAEPETMVCFIEKMEMESQLKHFEKCLEEDYVYLHGGNCSVVNFYDYGIYINLSYMKTWALNNLKLLKNYPLYEKQKEYKFNYLGKDFIVYDHSKEEQEIKKCIDDKKWLLENLSDTTRDKKLTSKRRL